MGKLGNSLPTYEHVLFKSSNLELCVVQIKYPPVQRFSDEQYLTGIKEALAEDYPLTSEERGINILVTPQGVNPAPGAVVHRFNSIDFRWSVVLTSESIALETREYTDFEELSARFDKLVRHVAKYFCPHYQLRLGIRYINEFRHHDGDTYEVWHRLLNKELVSSATQTVVGGRVEQTINEVRIRRDDGILLVRHGFLNGTTVLPILHHPAKNGPFYLLDLDYYDETSIEFEESAPTEKIRDYNDVLYRVFRWSIGEGELYQQLRG
mgnify:CR=1 FL=1